MTDLVLILVVVLLIPALCLVVRLSKWLQKPFEKLLITLGIAKKIKYWE